MLIQGASSGVGLMGLQIAKLKGAAVVMGTSTDEGRRARLKEYGCDSRSIRAIRNGPKRSRRRPAARASI